MNSWIKILSKPQSKKDLDNLLLPFYTGLNFVRKWTLLKMKYIHTTYVYVSQRKIKTFVTVVVNLQIFLIIIFMS